MITVLIQSISLAQNSMGRCEFNVTFSVADQREAAKLNAILQKGEVGIDAPDTPDGIARKDLMFDSETMFTVCRDQKDLPSLLARNGANAPIASMAFRTAHAVQRMIVHLEGVARSFR